mgnify:CR=1 FL=1
MLALRGRDLTGEGQVIDLALYETIFRMLDEIAPAFQQFGLVRERMGADTVNVVPHSHYRTSDGRWIAIACSNDDMFGRLAQAMGRPELADPDAYGPKPARLAARDEVNTLVGDWVGSLACSEVLGRCNAAGVPAGQLYSIADIFEDPQYAHRGNIVTEPSRIGPLAVPAVLPTLGGTPGAIRWLGPGLGEHTEEVLTGLLGIEAGELSRLMDLGVI